MSLLKDFTDLGNFYADKGGNRPYLEKEAMHIWMILRGMQEAIIIQNLRGMSTGGDSRDVRGSHGVLFISSGNW